jgi:hypothetical protein
MKKLLFTILVIHILSNSASASIFPNDTKTAYIDVTAGTSGTLLPAISEHDRTILYATIRAVPSIDCAILIGASQYLSSLGNTTMETFAPQIILANESVTYIKTQNKQCVLRVAYTDYDLSLVPNNVATIASVSFPSEFKVASTSHDMTLTASSSIQVYGTMTAGDIAVIVSLFGVITLMFLMLFFHKV